MPPVACIYRSTRGQCALDEASWCLWIDVRRLADELDVMIGHLRVSHPPPPTNNDTTNRDALSRKVEGDAEAKADFNALKNQWDAIEKDFATYGAKAVRDWGAVWVSFVLEGWLGKGGRVCVCHAGSPADCLLNPRPSRLQSNTNTNENRPRRSTGRTTASRSRRPASSSSSRSVRVPFFLSRNPCVSFLCCPSLAPSAAVCLIHRSTSHPTSFPWIRSNATTRLSGARSRPAPPSPSRR